MLPGLVMLFAAGNFIAAVVLRSALAALVGVGSIASMAFLMPSQASGRRR